MASSLYILILKYVTLKKHYYIEFENGIFILVLILYEKSQTRDIRNIGSVIGQFNRKGKNKKANKEMKVWKGKQVSVPQFSHMRRASFLYSFLNLHVNEE